MTDEYNSRRKPSLVTKIAMTTSLLALIVATSSGCKHLAYQNKKLKGKIEWQDEMIRKGADPRHFRGAFGIYPAN